MTAAALGPRQAAILAHLEEHPGRTATELARAFGLPTVCTSSWAALSSWPSSSASRSGIRSRAGR